MSRRHTRNRFALSSLQRGVRAIVTQGAVACGAVTPQRAEELVPAAIDGGLDVLVIAGITVSAEHVSRSNITLDLETFVRARSICR